MATLSRSATLAAALLAASTVASAGDPPAEKPAATVRGATISRREVYETLARRRLRGEEGAKLRERFLLEAVARREQERRGIAITEEEVQAAIEDARRRLAEGFARQGRRLGKGDPLEDLLKERGCTMAEFVDQTRDYLAIQRMARTDLGAPGEVSGAQLEVWMRDLAGKRGASADPATMKPGEAARIGEESVGLEEAGRWIARTGRREDTLSVLWDLVFAKDVEGRAVREGVALAIEEVEAEVTRLRQEFRRQPGAEEADASFDDWLRDLVGMTLAEYRADPSFLANLLSKKLLAPGLSPEAVRKEWEAHPERYGETARIRVLAVRGEDRASAFGASARPMAEARKLADAALGEIRAGKDFESVARKRSEDSPTEEARGRPLDVVPHPTTTGLPQPVLDAVFQAKDGDLLGPVRAVDGWYLVKVERRVPAPAFEKCARRVREDLLAQRIRDWKIALRADPEVVVARDL